MASTTPETLLGLMFEVGRVVRSAGQDSRTALIPLSCLETMKFIGESKDPSMQDIARYLRVTAPSATGLIESLAKKGYITRAGDARDRRKVRLAVSRKGKTLLAGALKDRTRAMRAILKVLTLGEQAAFAKILTKLTTTSYGR